MTCREEGVARRLRGSRESSRSGAKRETGREACEGGAGHVARNGRRVQGEGREVLPVYKFV